MKLYHYQDPNGLINFGDDLNPWLWDHLLPKGFLDSDPSHLLIGIGTLLNDNLPKASEYSVFGSGVGYGSRAPIVNSNWNIYALRGPLSAKALGVDEKLAITDGAYLLKGIVSEVPKKEFKVSYMPHFNLARPSLEIWCNQIGINYIDPSKPILDTLNDILKTELLLTEAMHGAIVSDCFRIPWIPVKSSKTILDFKWIDWCSSLGIDYDPVEIIPIWENVSGKYHKEIINFSKSKINENIFKKTIKKSPRTLSKDDISRARYDQLEEKLHAMVERNNGN